MKKIKVILLIIVVSGLLHINLFASENEGQVEYKLGENISLRGSFGTHDWYFYVEEPWQVTNSQLSLNYIGTQLLTSPRSTLTLSLNGETFYSIGLNSVKEQNLTLSLPVNQIKAGYNKISIKAYVRLTEDHHTDAVNPASWVKLFKESNIKLEYTEPKQNNLNVFPYPFIQTQSKAITQIVIPEVYTKNELEAALWMASYLGSYTDESELINIQAESTLQQVKNAIIIGNEQYIKQLYPDLAFNLGNKGLIFLEQIGPYSRLIICANNEDILDTAFQILSDDQIIGQIDKPYYIIPEELTLKNDLKTDQKIHFTLKELGYDSIYMMGQHRNQTSIFINLPSETILQKGAKLVIHTRYSKNLNFEHSLVTLYINGEALASSKLDITKADGDTIELSIPPDIQMNKASQVTIAFDLELDINAAVTREEDTPWVLIENSSYFYLPRGSIKEYSFDVFPYPFVQEGKMQDIGVIVPDKLNAEDLIVLGRLFEKIGAYTQQYEGNISIINGSIPIEEVEDKHLIVYGTPVNNQFIQNIKKQSFLQFSENEQYFLPNEEVHLLPEYSRNLILCEMKPSTVNSRYGMLSMIAPKEQVFKEILGQRVSIPNLKGQVLIMDERGEGRLYRPILEEHSEKVVVNNKVQNGGNGQSQQVIGIFIGSIILLSIFLIGFLSYKKYK